MASTGITNGTLIAIYKEVSGTLTKIANATSNDFSISKDMIETTNKDSAGAKEYIAGEYGYTMSVEGMFEEDGSVGASISWKEIITDLIAGTSVTIVMTSNVSGDLKLSGAAFFSELNLTAPQNDVATFTASIQGTGALTVSTITP
jgi:TP901-1 family phage major tail protein